MDQLSEQIAALPTIQIGGQRYLSYQAVTDAVAASLFPGAAPAEIGADDYRQILEQAEAVCRALGYTSVEKLVPPAVPFPAMGLYWVRAPETEKEESETCGDVIAAGPGRVEELQSFRLVDARLGRHGLDEVIRQHFNIPVTVSDGVYNLMRRAVEGPWPNDWKGIMHDVLGMCIAAGRDTGPTERAFTVIIRGVGRRRYWPMKALLKADHAGNPYLFIMLAGEQDGGQLFELGHVVATAGAAALNVDFTPYLARHASGDDGDLDAFDKRQNRQAVREGLRILSAYDVPVGDGKTERIWIITESDRSTTSVLLPSEY
jgi:hypothetical protein